MSVEAPDLSTNRNLTSPGGRHIRPARVRYIKLGGGGSWEAEWITKGIIRFGFQSASAERFPLCRAGRWAELTQSFLAEGKTKGTATRFTNETRQFFADDGSTLWITFSGRRAPPRRQDLIAGTDATTRIEEQPLKVA